MNLLRYSLLPVAWALGLSPGVPSPIRRLRGLCDHWIHDVKTLGFAVDSLQIVVIEDKLRSEAHAVLAVYMENQIYIMDSLVEGVLTQDHFNFYIPQYSVNETTLWAHIMPLPSTLNYAAAGSIR